jgi:uncharacterized protein (DUF3820 family)
MIEINLLPPEMRKVDRTSMKRLTTMVTAVVLLSASVIGVTVFLKGYYSEKSENVVLDSEARRLEPLAKEYDVLSAELKAIETRIATIDEIRTTRLRWGRKLDQMYAILPDYVWFEKVELKQTKAASAAGAGATSKVVLECYLAGADEKRYSEFRRILSGEVVADGPYKGADFIADFSSLGYSGWARQDFPETEEGVALKFNLELEVKPLVPAVAPVKAPRPVVAAQQ